MYLGIAILCAAIVPSFSYRDIHKYMSPEEVQGVFNSDVHSVPEYEVVKLHVSERLHKRESPAPAGGRLHTIALGTDIDLWLNPRDSVLFGDDVPVYYAKRSDSAPQGVQFRRQDGLLRMLGMIYENRHKRASFVIGTDDAGRTKVNGYIESSGLVVRSLPQRVVEEYSRRRRSLDGDSEHPQHSPYHVVIRTNQTLPEHDPHSPGNSTRLRERLARQTTVVPETVYVETLVVVENSMYMAYNTPGGYDIYRLLDYLVVFWNGVDLKYRSLESPKIRLNIAGIVLAEDSEVTPYISQFANIPEAFADPRAVSKTKSFWYEVKDSVPIESYDISVTLSRRGFGGEDWTWGVSIVGSICTSSDEYRTKDGVALVRDDGVFMGVRIAAHELGHTLGSHHDGTAVAPTCSYDDGYLMASSAHYTVHTSDFSPCTLEQFRKRINDNKWACLYNRPSNTGGRRPKLPGKWMNADAQCRTQWSGGSCQHLHPEHSICLNMYCFDEGGRCGETKVSALDGTVCGDANHFCLHQQCVQL